MTHRGCDLRGIWAVHQLISSSAPDIDRPACTASWIKCLLVLELHVCCVGAERGQMIKPDCPSHLPVGNHSQLAAKSRLDWFKKVM